ncbi:MAG: hypothetical protein IJZ79_05875, partial [Bacilli bacterium]|nr:hypothetical protein [Bacilli bacterium]
EIIKNIGFIENSNIIDKFHNDLDSFTNEDIQELINYIGVVKLNESVENNMSISLEELNSIYNYINDKLFGNRNLIGDQYIELYINNYLEDINKLGNTDINDKQIDTLYSLIVNDGEGILNIKNEQTLVMSFQTPKLGDKLLDSDTVENYLLSEDVQFNADLVKYLYQHQDNEILSLAKKNDSKLYHMYLNSVVDGTIILKQSNSYVITEIINALRNHINHPSLLEIKEESYKNSYINYNYENVYKFIKNSGYLENNNILDKFRNDLDSFTPSDLRNLIDYVDMFEIFELSGNKDNIDISSDELNKIYNYINKMLLEDALSMVSCISTGHLQSHLYNFAKYFSKLNNIDLKVYFYNEDSTTGGRSYGDLIVFNTKYFTETFKTKNIFFDKLNTIFHEVFHEMQGQERKLNITNKYNLIQTIERLIRKESEEYYKDNYHNISYEVDARYNAMVFLSNYIKEISPETYQKFENYINEKMNEDSALYMVNKNVFGVDDLKFNRDIFFDNMVRKNPSILDNNPILKYIYNTDGSRKTIFELHNIIIDNQNNKNIINMINHWMKMSNYSLDNMINELYSIYMTDSSIIPKEYFGYIHDIQNSKFYETIIQESNNFNNVDFMNRVKEQFERLKQENPNDIADIEEFADYIISRIEEIKNNTFTEESEFIDLLSEDEIINDEIVDGEQIFDKDGNILNIDVFKDKVEELINYEDISLEDVVSENKESFSKLIDKNLDSNFDLLYDKVLKYLDIKTLHEHISMKQIGNLSSETFKKFDEKFPGLISKIQFYDLYGDHITVENIFDNSDPSLLIAFANYDNYSELFKLMSKDEYINNAYNYLMSEDRLLSKDDNEFKQQLKSYLQIDGLKQMLLNNKEVIEYIEKNTTMSSLLKDDYIYNLVSKDSQTYIAYIQDVIDGKIEINPSRMIEIIELCIKNKEDLIITSPEVIDYCQTHNVLRENAAVDKFRNNPSKLTSAEVQQIIKYMGSLEYLENNGVKLDIYITPDEHNSMFNYINALLLKDNYAIDRKYYQDHIYNFAKYYSRLNGLDIDVKFFYENNKTAGFSSEGSIAFNTKFFNQKYKTKNIFMDRLDTIFHEIFHEIQKQERDLSIPNKYNLIATIERLIRNNNDSYYDINYKNISYEIDARYNASILLSNYIKKISPEVYNKNYIYISKSIDRDSKLYEINQNTSLAFGLGLNRDSILEKIVRSKSSILKSNPILNYIFNENGTRKTLFELADVIANTTDQNIVNMINYWIRNSRYSVDSLINEMYSIYFNNPDMLLKEFQNTINNLFDVKFLDTIMLESNYFGDKEFYNKLQNKLSQLKEKSKYKDSFDEFSQVILNNYQKHEKKLKNNLQVIKNRTLIKMITIMSKSEINQNDYNKNLNFIKLNNYENYKYSLLNNLFKNQRKNGFKKLSNFRLFNNNYKQDLSSDSISSTIFQENSIDKIPNFIKGRTISNFDQFFYDDKFNYNDFEDLLSEDEIVEKEFIDNIEDNTDKVDFKLFNDDVMQFLIDKNIDIDGIMKMEEAKLCDSSMRSIISEYVISDGSEISYISVADIIGHLKISGKNILSTMNNFFDSKQNSYYTKSITMLDYNNGKEMIYGLEHYVGQDGIERNIFLSEPMCVEEIKDGKFIITSNGLHRFTLLRIHYLNELLKSNSDISKLKEKYMIPVKIEKVNYFKTYSNYILSLLNDDISFISNVSNQDRTMSDEMEICFENQANKIVNKSQLMSLVKDTLDNVSEYDKKIILRRYKTDIYFKNYLDDNFSEFVEGLLI